MFALPFELHEQGVRRYGFHGLSYEYVASVLPSFDSAAAGGRTVVLHLGNGSSMCAIRAGKSVASTMARARRGAGDARAVLTAAAHFHSFHRSSATMTSEILRRVRRAFSQGPGLQKEPGSGGGFHQESAGTHAQAVPVTAHR